MVLGFEKPLDQSPAIDTTFFIAHIKTSLFGMKRFSKAPIVGAIYIGYVEFGPFRMRFFKNLFSNLNAPLHSN